GAGLRVRSVATLLDRALAEYEAAVEVGAKLGLNDAQERKLRGAGLDLKGASHVLTEAQRRGYLKEDDERVETLAVNFDRLGYSGLMTFYIEQVREIRDLAISEGIAVEEEAVAWQELGWKLTSLFTQTLEIGKGIAILNTFTFRLPADVLAVAAGGAKAF